MYRSSFTAGFLSTLHLRLLPPAHGPDGLIFRIPASLTLIHVRIIVEGNLFSKLLEPDHDLRFTYAWNKRNVYRQKVYGLTNAKGKALISLTSKEVSPLQSSVSQAEVVNQNPLRPDIQNCMNQT